MLLSDAYACPSQMVVSPLIACQVDTAFSFALHGQHGVDKWSVLAEQYTTTAYWACNPQLYCR